MAGEAIVPTACGAAIGLGAAGSLPWWVSAIALSSWAASVRRTQASAKRVRPSLGIALGALAMQLAGGWWLGLGVNAPGDALGWQVLVVAMTVGLQVAWLGGAWALATRAVTELPSRSTNAAPGVAWCLAWGTAETLREIGPTGYGYTSLGTAFIDLPVLSSWVAVIGSHGLSVVVALLAWLAAGAVAPSATPTDRFRRWRAALVTTLAVAGLGQALTMVSWTHADGAPIAVTVLQDATDKRQVWAAAERDLAEDRLLEAVRSTPPGGIVATPEGHFAEPLPLRPDEFWQTLRDEAQARGLHVLVGMPQRARDGDDRLMLNAIVQIAPERIGLYAKERLVPGGESLPFPALLSAVYDGAFQGQGGAPRVAESAAPRALTRPLFVAGAQVGASICHELSFTTTVAERARGSAWLLNAADDAWIPSAAYRRQLAVIARTRALELAKPLLRVTDGGASMLVGPDGRIERTAPALTPALLHWQVQPRSGSTPYERHAGTLSIAPAMALGVLALAAIVLRRRRPATLDPRLP